VRRRKSKDILPAVGLSYTMAASDGNAIRSSETSLLLLTGWGSENSPSVRADLPRAHRRAGRMADSKELIASLVTDEASE
jgi:hypothetical protein